MGSMAEPASKKSDKQIMDVAKPGKSPADASARPIIVGHGPRVQDPMVNTPEADDPDEPKTETASAITPTSKKVIAPIPETENIPDETIVQSADKPEEVPETTDTDISDSAIVDAVVDQVGNKNKEDQSTDEDKKKQEAIDKLVLEKKYFVPIGRAHKKRNARWAFILLLIIIVGGGGALFAADAGVLNLGFTPPFDFIKNQSNSTKPEEVATTPQSVTPARVSSQMATVTAETSQKNDSERKTDINATHGQVEAYFAQTGKYPTLNNLNDKAFRSANLKGLDDSALKDPEGLESVLVAVPAVKSYSYAVTTLTGAKCDNSVTDCVKYTLTATLSDATTYQKQQLN